MLGPSSRCLPALAGGAALGLLLAGPARAQPVNPDQPGGMPALPAPITAQPSEPLAAPPVPEIRLGDVRSLLGQAPEQPPTTPARNWTIVPTLAVQELATDNVLASANGRRADLVTTISPGILVDGDTQRLRLTLSYTPTVQVYAFTAHQNNIVQNLNGQAVATVAPDWLFVNLQAFATQQAISGGFAPTGTPLLANQNRANVESVTFSPYLNHIFDGIGTVRLGYAFNYTAQTGTEAFLPTSPLPFFINNDIASNEEFAKFATGSNFGRLSDKVLLDAVQNRGFGVVQHSRQNFYINEFGYDLNRSLKLLVEGGYEQIAYPNGLPPIRINDPVWGGGFKWQPNPDSTVIALYRHLYGFNAPYIDASYALTARTRIYANYSDTLGTGTQLLQDLLAETTLGQNANPLDYQTGAPVLLTNQLFGLQLGLLRQKQLSLSASTTFARDTVSLTVLHQVQNLLSVSPGTSGFSQTGTSGGISWTHALTPQATSTVYVQYGTVSYSTPGVPGTTSGPTFTGSLSLAYNFSESLSGTVQYIVTNSSIGTFGVQTFGAPSQTVLQNIVLVGALKKF